MSATTRSRWFCRARVACGMVGVVAACTACSIFEGIEAQPAEFRTPTTIAGRPDAPLVLMVGDSITQFSQPELAFTFTTRGWSSAVVGHSGTTTLENRGRILGAVAQRPDVLVVQLGTNDALQAGNPSDGGRPERREARLDAARDQIDAALDDADGIACVLWVDLNDWTDTPLLALAETAPTLNRELESQASERSKFSIIPYAATFRPATPEAADFLQRTFDPEGLHPVNPAARARYATLVADAVADACKI